jgi:PmbA protein
MAIIEHGVLKCHLHDCYSAKKLGTTSNHAAGGPFGLNVGVGKLQRKELFALAPGKVLYVDRFSGNVDALTGDFSGVAKSSHIYENGEHLYPVMETMIAGNVFDLIDQIVGVGKEQILISDMMACPEMVVGGVNVSGK